ncbi:MAG: DMT family transporter [Chloroflexota bacterium]
MPLQSLPYIFILGSLYGTTLIASRFGISQFSPLTYVMLRLVLASLGIILILLIPNNGRKWPTDKSLKKHATLLGIFGTAIPMTLIVIALQYQSSGISAIIITLGPVIAVVVAHFFLDDEQITRNKTFGIGIALTGAILLVALGESGLPDIKQVNPLGYLLTFLAIFSGNSMMVYARKHMTSFDSFQVGSIRIIVAALVLIPVSLFMDGFDLSGVHTQGYFALGWAALSGTLLGQLFEFVIVKRFGATATAMTSYIIPIVAAIGGWLLLGEIITSGILLSMIIIIVGIAILNQPDFKVNRAEKAIK